MKEMSLFHLVFGPAFIIRKWNNWKGWWISPQPSLLLSHEDEQAPYPKHKDVTFRRARDKLKSRPGATVAPCLLFSSLFINNQYSGPRRDSSSRAITRVIWEKTFLVLFFFSFPKDCVYFYTFIFAGFEKRQFGEVRMQNAFNVKRGKSNEISHPKVASRMWLCCLCLGSNQNYVVIVLPRSSSPKQVLCRSTRQIPDLSLNAWGTVKISPV